MTRGRRLVLMLHQKPKDPFLLMILDDYWFLEAKFLTTHWAEWLAFFETLSSSIWKKVEEQLPNLPYQRKGNRVFDTMGHKIAALSASDARVVKSEEPQRTLHCFRLYRKKSTSGHSNIRFLVGQVPGSKKYTHKKNYLQNEEMNDLAFLGSHLNGIFVEESSWSYLKIPTFGLNAKISL